jgi:hypothetical protein
MRALRNALFLSLLASSAAANGRFPAASQLVVRPGHTEQMSLRTTFGLLVSHDAGKSWDWICETAMGYGGQEDPGIGVTAGGTTLLGTTQGLSLSANGGCDWSFHAFGLRPVGYPTGRERIADVTVRSDRPSSALVLTAPFITTTSWDTRLYETVDDGKTFSPKYTFDTSLLGWSVEAAPPKRVYVTAGRTTSMPVLLVSDDDGVTFVERPIPPDTRETAVFIAGVDPFSADRVYLRTQGPLDEFGNITFGRLLFSNDAGQSFKTIFTGQALAGFALSKDATKVWIGGPKDGINVASTTDFVFAQTTTTPITCLAQIDGFLYACPNLALATTDGASFTKLLDFSDVRGPLACPMGSTTDTCAYDWPGVQRTIGAGKDMDAGFTPHPILPDTGGGGCGCNAGSAGGAWIAAALAMLSLRCRRRSRPSR